MNSSSMVLAGVMALASVVAMANEGNNLAAVEQPAGSGVYHSATYPASGMAATARPAPQPGPQVEVAASPDSDNGRAAAGR